MADEHLPNEVAAIRAKIRDALDLEYEPGRRIGNYRYGVYAFYDYDGEPIYVGQTYESLRTRIRRHLTNQRTDAVAMNVLDPFEVCSIEMWPLFYSGSDAPTDVKDVLDATEFTVYGRLLKSSTFGAVLNEKPPKETAPIGLPRSVRVGIVPEDVLRLRGHTDIRIARRASTIASLAKVISERSVSSGLRRTLVVQAERLRWLADRRSQEVGPSVQEEETPEE